MPATHLDCNYPNKRCVGTLDGRYVYLVDGVSYYLRVEGQYGGGQFCYLALIPGVAVPAINFSEEACKGAPN